MQSLSHTVEMLSLPRGCTLHYQAYLKTADSLLPYNEDVTAVSIGSCLQHGTAEVVSHEALRHPNPALAGHIVLGEKTRLQQP